VIEVAQLIRAINLTHHYLKQSGHKMSQASLWTK